MAQTLGEGTKKVWPRSRDPPAEETLELTKPRDDEGPAHQHGDLEEARTHRLPREGHARRMDESSRFHTTRVRHLT
jgi:hypothetical protein